MLILSWNVNGIRSAIKKGLKTLVDSKRYDIILLQEVKTDYIPLEIEDSGYLSYLFPSKAKKGYSGTATLSKSKPMSFRYGIGVEKFDSEGMVITLEFDGFYVVNVYFPHSRRDLSRLGFKLEFDEAMEKFSKELSKHKPVVIGGDFNVAHQDIDIARPKDNEGNAGFTREEREWFSRFLKSGYVDAYRLFVKDGGHYTWWTYRFNAKSNNIGWRIDYFVVSNGLKDSLNGAGILKDVLGSDHVPVYLDMN